MTDFDGYVGSWNATLEPIITSIGSFTGEEGIIATNDQLQEAISTDMSNLGVASAEGTNVKTLDQKELGAQNDESKNGENVLVTETIKLKEFEIEKK